ncbi:hypothetical protein GCK72_017942 [Caenorhabditis remanei]|uniref:Uncharacterized protein n=1 Tax=Caenorhabditis remanei TaxID=31234 RepID=A0A6A5G8G0_CAERE|nr:hypothetical protein GCK72_017942 [Caenorhabditis remanei]KAF1751388.1 hypothetical protein GCK72_017942 [Caenorhabditis remanei]
MVFIIHGYLGGWLGILSKSFSLRLEDLDVGGKKILALHSLASWHCSNEESVIDSSECSLLLGDSLDAVKSWESTILELENNSFENIGALWNIEEDELHWLFLSEDGSVGDTDYNGVSDLASGSSNQNAKWGSHSEIF